MSIKNISRISRNLCRSVRNRLGGNVRLMIVGSDTPPKLLVWAILHTLVWNLILRELLNQVGSAGRQCAHLHARHPWLHHRGGVSWLIFGDPIWSDFILNLINLATNSPPRYGQTECVAPCTLTTPGDPQPDHVRWYDMFQNILSLERWHFPLNIKSQQSWRKAKENIVENNEKLRSVLRWLATTSSWQMCLTWNTSPLVARERYLFHILISSNTLSSISYLILSSSQGYCNSKTSKMYDIETCMAGVRDWQQRFPGLLQVRYNRTAMY